jgi:acid phosphatase type 7
MSPPPIDGPPVPRRLPFGQRLVVDAAAVVLVVTAGLVGALPSGPASSPGASATPNGTQVATPEATPVATPASAQPTSTPVPSQLLEFPVTADSYVYAGRPDLNYGTTAELRVDSDPETLTYLQFTVSGLTTRVLGATLRIHALGRQTLGFQVRSIEGSWSESTLTYAAQPAQGALVGRSGLVPGEASVEVELTPVIAGNGQFSFVLFTDSTTALTFASREAGSATAAVLVVKVAQAPGG